MEILGTGAPQRRLVTHVFPLDELQRAVEIAAGRDAGAIKVLLAPSLDACACSLT